MSGPGAIEAPMQLEVRASGDSATERVVAVCAQLAIERVAPFATVHLSGADGIAATGSADGPSADAVVQATGDAVGVLADGGGPDVERARMTSEVPSTAAVLEDDHGRWFRSDDDGQRVELSGLSPWALIGVALGAARFHPSTPAGYALADFLRGALEGDPATDTRREAALAWARAQVDIALSAVAQRDPARVRRWLTELDIELAHVRSAHDALRNRYDRDLDAVAGPSRG
ncbi:MAG: hypothetical protein P8N02_05955 [Actinomycetota bacterium]|jgi:hypothetical protein|nr:hypothetical protein [Actinomycetota bacterium]